MNLRRSLRLWRMSVRGRPRKPDHSQDEEKKQHIFTIRKGVFVSFQRCKTLGVDHLVEMGQIKTIIFSEKKGLKHTFWWTRSWINWLQSWLGPKILKVSPVTTCSLKNLGFKLRNGRWLQYCLIVGYSKFNEFCALTRNQCGTNDIKPTLIPCQSLKLISLAVSSSLKAPFPFVSWILTRLWQPRSMT